MALLNASGAPVAHQAVTMQLDLPCEAAGPSSVGAVNIVAVITAIMQLIGAVTSGDTAQIVAAISALIKAITGA